MSFTSEKKICVIVWIDFLSPMIPSKKQIVIPLFLSMNILFLFCFGNCSAPAPSTASSPSSNPKQRGDASVPGKKNFYPAGESEEIVDESGNPVSITENDFSYFQLPSKDPTEMFRVLISGKKYQLRQIRGSKFLRRKPDPGGDALIVEDVAKFDGIRDLLDDGTIVIKLNPKSGKIENVNFGTRTTRVGNFSKIIQNDSTRWNIEHKTPEPTITKYMVTYYIQVSGAASRDEIKEKLRGEVKK